MLEINLLPKEMRVIKRQTVSDSVYFWPVVAVAVGVVGFLVFVYLLMGAISGAKFKAVERLETEWGSMMSRKLEFDKVSSEISELSKAVDSIREMSEPDVNWTMLLNGLGRAVTPGVWLSRLNLEGQGRVFDYRDTNEKPKGIVLTGHALGSSGVGTAEVAKFIASLKSTQDFEKFFQEIELVDMRAQPLLEHDTMFFRLKCDFKKKEAQAGKAANLLKK